MDTPEVNAMPAQTSPRLRSRSRWELLAVAAFVLVNALAPLVCGELYPFTVSPMFSDQPQAYCTYELLDSNGQAIDAEPFGLHLVYDGNPPGLGMGIVPTPTLHSFGEVCDQATVVQHVRRVMKERKIDGPVTVRQTQVHGGAPQLSQTVNEWTILEATSQ